MSLTIAEVLDAARERGVGNLPTPSQLEVVRIWPTGMPSQWVAEVGEPPSNWPVGAIFETPEEATDAGVEEGNKRRTELAQALRTVGASEIADAEWPPLRVDRLDA
jgi:hypothetical protein